MNPKKMWRPTTHTWLLVGTLSGSVLVTACSSKDNTPGDQETPTTESGSTGGSSSNTSPGAQTTSELLPDDTQDSTTEELLTSSPEQTFPETTTQPGDTSTTSDATDSSDSDTGNGSLLGLVPKDLPKITGTCPNFVNAQLEFNLSGLKKTRKARVWISHESRTKQGPLVFYWHGDRAAPSETTLGLGEVVREVLDLGGIVVAPVAEKGGGSFSWAEAETTDQTRGTSDLLLADEILACAIKHVGVDLRHIHALGMGQGGLRTAQMSYQRSNYLASVATYSGGFIQDGVKMREPNNQIAAMIFHGGIKDGDKLKYQETSERYLKSLREDGNFGFICKHDQGHRVPREVTDQVWRFFQDHPFNQRPKPYERALPKGFPDYCSYP